jgi:hypothetical protein
MKQLSAIAFFEKVLRITERRISSQRQYDTNLKCMIRSSATANIPIAYCLNIQLSVQAVCKWYDSRKPSGNIKKG